jgi:opacity protein-like surface antigen
VFLLFCEFIMVLRRVFQTSLVLAASFLSLTAFGADMLPKVKAPPVQEDALSGYYVRADFGFSKFSRPGMNYDAPLITRSLAQASLQSAINFGIGAGIKINWARFDATLDYRTAQNYRDSTPCWFAGCGAVNYANTGQISSLTGLLNSYFDLGTWSGITPYLGAGLGLSQVSLKKFTVQTYDGIGMVTTSIGSKSKIGVAHALMAGVNYDINKTIALDLGYRYLGLGHGISENMPANANLNLTSLKAHEIRIGMRYMFASN